MGRIETEEEKTEFLRGFELAVDGDASSADPATQLAAALDLMVVRLRMDYTSPRYRGVCQEFTDGLQLKSGATWEEVGSRYSEAFHNFYFPFMKTYEYMLEHYLVAYAFKTMFPFGSPAVNKILDLEKSTNRIVGQYLLMASYFVVVRAVLIGLAAQHRSEFSTGRVLRAAFSRLPRRWNIASHIRYEC